MQDLIRKGHTNAFHTNAFQEVSESYYQKILIGPIALSIVSESLSGSVM